MLKTRVIPSLLLKNGGLVKTVKFGSPKYVGDPINAIKIFNDKEVDELVILDIEASKNTKGIDFDLLTRINKEAFMPLGYGGGIKNIQDAKRIFNLGYEKIIINSAALYNPKLITEISNISGNQSTVVCIDVKKNIFGKYYVFDHVKNKLTDLNPFDYVKTIEKLGAGELIVYSVDQEGTFKGYDLNLIKGVSEIVNIPVVALGGANDVEDLAKAINIGASAVSAGSMFVFHGPHHAVLITYPDKKTLKNLFENNSK